MQWIAGSLFQYFGSNRSSTAEIPLSIPVATGGQILGSNMLSPHDISGPVVVWQLCTCGIPSTITAIMRASLCIGSMGPGGCSSPGIPPGLGSGGPCGC